MDVAVGGDGKLLAYVAREGGGQAIHLREMSATEERSAFNESQGNVSGLMFSPDSSFLYYRRSGNDGIGELVRVPAKGGPPERVAGNVSGAASLSPASMNALLRQPAFPIAAFRSRSPGTAG